MDINFILTLVGLIISAVGGFLTYRQIASTKTRNWMSTIASIDKMGRWAKKRGEKYDVIVSYSDGGLIVADLLSIRHFPNVPVLAVPMVTEAGRYSAAVEVAKGFSMTLIGVKKILLVDDVIQTGKNLHAAERFLISKFNILEGDIDTAVIAKLQGVEDLKVDFEAFTYQSKIKLPWGTTPRNNDDEVI